MSTTTLGPLRFNEQYMHRIWGGRRLASLFGKPLPPEVPIGEAWLISDHPNAESKVSDGPLRGQTLRQLLEDNPRAILGSRAQLTIHGRFPLLLKILDSSDWLSVQVHPDDACAVRLGEPDVGKTEMWHVLHAEPASQLICGLDPRVTPSEFMDASRNDALDPLLPRFSVAVGDSVFVRAGTVHAIGGGIVLAEIQQNSDLTYRIHDWGRVDDSGNPRELHLDKAKQAIHFGSKHGGKSLPLALPSTPGHEATRELLAACHYFAAERVQCPSIWRRETRAETFHILLCTRGSARVTAGSGTTELQPGQACLIPGGLPMFTCNGPCTLLDYYVPDLNLDIREPLRAAGHASEAIERLVSGGEGA